MKKVNTTVTLELEVRDKAKEIFERKSQKMSAVLNNYLKKLIKEDSNESN